LRNSNKQTKQNNNSVIPAYAEVYLLTARSRHIRMGAPSSFVFVSLVSLPHIVVAVAVGNIAGASEFVCEPRL
jgi:flavin reductase (DIM6/NTAB) family NADH-FMN oxidoreductase RutF